MIVHTPMFGDDGCLFRLDIDWSEFFPTFTVSEWPLCNTSYLAHDRLYFKIGDDFCAMVWQSTIGL